MQFGTLLAKNISAFTLSNHVELKTAYRYNQKGTRPPQNGRFMQLQLPDEGTFLALPAYIRCA
jgi:hypothetical protein